ncbi:actinia tenebrosa protease inhibitors-like [Daphnia pulicaria]|uniref:actinia tenebrosa protease inhibitors-like n=1 Tax=Daphnia pulicaria TaxID=35523 RepID=UPI001EECE343|nr:actinia tenebrosa protease inhibitors-like [Daphnia pulicaria]
MDSLKWIIFLCVLTSTAAANLPLSESSEENYVDGVAANDDDGNVTEGESITDVGICKLPPINYSTNQRHCSGFIPRWYYHVQSSSCKKFFWDGCWGTKNLFRNEFACLARCNKQGLQQKISESDPSTPCMQPKAVGSCRASIPSYFFDMQTGQCTPFNYGGCGGNDNRFKSYHECDFKCNRIEQAPLTRPQFANSTTNASAVTISAAAEKVTVVQMTKEEKCSLPPVELINNSSCLAFIPSWTFDSTAGECRPFLYEGCGKTANLFNSEDECNTACGPEPTTSGPASSPPPPCLQPKVIGPCRASIPIFFFDATTGVCTPFNYGGCRGNDNRFISEKACQLACSGPEVGLGMSEDELLPVSAESEEI